MIKLAKPYIPYEAIQQVEEVLISGNLVQGKFVQEFEQKLADYLDVENVIVVSSGTAALHLSLIALGIKAGDEVIVPAFTFPATANVVELVGAKPILVDINLDDFCIDTSQIEVAITEKTKAIMPVHEFGQAAEIDVIMDIANKYNLMVIEDAACALGTEYNSKKVGTFGKAGCFSFHPRKAITTGEGGAIVTNDDEIAKMVRILRNHGSWQSNRKVDFICAGYNYRMTDFQAALGFSQLNFLENLIEKRILIANFYNEKLSKFDCIILPSNIKNRKNIYQTYHIIFKGIVERNKIIENLNKAGIETNIGAYALNCLYYYQNKHGYKNGEFLNAEEAYFNGLALPIGTHISKDDANYIVRILEKEIS